MGAPPRRPPDTFLEPPESSVFAPLRRAEAPGLVAGGIFAGYTIEAVAGTGATSTVYRARQPHPQRTVALKVLKGPLLSARMLRRFEHESDLLARVKHPNIAQVFDAGTEDSSLGPQPFIAMEYVTGTPVTTHARERNLDRDARLRLFVKVCAAVHHAHQRGVVHRDLKPGNVLVEPDGTPKVLDFGVARVVAGDAPMTQLTRAGELIGTIPYMSPEQVSGHADAIDARSDVYALGVILYELMTGTLPYDIKDVGVSEAARIICDHEPVSPAAHRRELRGDLSTVMLKALEKELDRRYASVGAMSDDIERILMDQTITARPPSTSYVLRKFVARHKGLVAGVAVAAVALVSGTFVSATMALRATQARDRAETEARNLLALNDFLTRMLQAPRPPEKATGAAKQDIKVVDVLDDAAINLAGTYAEQPLVEAALRATLANTYWVLDRFDAWERQYDLVLAQRRDVLGNDHLDVLLTQLTMVDGRNSLERYADAEMILRDACPRCERVLGSNDPTTIRCLRSLALSLFHQRRWDESLAFCRRAIELAEATLPPEDHQRLSARRLMAQLTIDRSSSGPALAALKDIVALYGSSVGRDHYQFQHGQMWLAEALFEVSRPDEAIEILRQTDRFWRRVGGNEYHMVAANDWLLGRALTSAGEFEEAERRLETSADITAQQRHETSAQAVQRRLAHAECVVRLGDAQRAYHIVQPVLARLERQPIHDPIAMTETRNLLGRVLFARGSFDEAEAHLKVAVDGSREWADWHPRAIEIRCDYARCLETLGRRGEAEELLQACHAIASEHFGPDARRTRVVAELTKSLLDG